MNIGNLIQVIIALIMLTSIYLSYKSVKENNQTQKDILFNEIIKLETEILQDLFDKFEKEKNFIIHGEKLDNIDEQFARKYLNFYNYIATLKNQNKIDEDLFYSTFLNDFEKVYDIFMMYKTYEYRIKNYQDLCKFFNSLDLSIKESKPLT